jgi:xanthine dehydrogenase YagR molybdenum-binding subunit
MSDGDHLVGWGMATSKLARRSEVEQSIGKPIARVDGIMKVTGKAIYTADQPVPGLVHAVLVVSSIAKGRIVALDTSDAERVPGVLAILTHKSGIKLAIDPTKVDSSQPADNALQLLQDERVFYGNQPVAVAVGEAVEAASEAAERVRVRYDAQAPSVSLDAPDSYGPKKAGGESDPGQSRRGDPQTAMNTADFRMEQIYSTPFHTHSPMEAHNTIAAWDGPKSLRSTIRRRESSAIESVWRSFWGSIPKMSVSFRCFSEVDSEAKGRHGRPP